jgi:transposase
MTDQQLLIRHRKVMIEEHLLQSSTVNDICYKYRVSRTTFYKWFGRYMIHGESALANKNRTIGIQPNQISKSLEKTILDFSYLYPTYGPMRISLHLRLKGISVGKTSVYNALKRNGLNHRKHRLQKLHLSENVIITKEQLPRRK